MSYRILGRPARAGSGRRVCAALRLVHLEDRCLPTTFVVTTTADAGAGSLRQAILDANALAGPDTIIFDSGVFATSQTITLTTGELTIADAVAVVGPPVKATISGNSQNRIFTIDVPGLTAQPVQLSSLTLTNGFAATLGGGGVLNNDEALTLTGVSITGCNTDRSGGAVVVIRAEATLTLTECALVGNSAAANGGAIFAEAESALTVTRTTISGNTGNGGGGLYTRGGGSLSITESTLANNKALGYKGGAIFVFPFGGGTTVIRSSTLSGNSAPRGGGIALLGNEPLTVQNCTVTSNTATIEGGGIYGLLGQIALESVIVANNTAPTGPDIYGSVSANFCLVEATAGATIKGSNNKLNLDPMLGPLTDNGGPTLTHALNPNSPAINAGSNPGGLTTDQRGPGFVRVDNGRADIGAVEGKVTSPIATAVIQDPVEGGTVYSVTVVYADDVAIDVSSLGTGDISVTGPNDFDTDLTLVGVDVNTNGTPRFATYQFTPPGGAWDGADFGTYTVSVVAGQVFNTDAVPLAVAAGVLGTFSVGFQDVYVVDIATDEDDGNTAPGDLSLREALRLSNTSVGLTDLIEFDPGLFGTARTISLNLGEIKITDAVTIQGPAAGLTIDARTASRILNIDAPDKTGQPVVISGLTLANGSATGDGGAILNQGEALSLTNIAIFGSTADGNGGAIAVAGNGASLSITEGRLIGNLAGPATVRHGGAIYVGGGKATVSRTTISGNRADGNGGGISFGGDALTVRECTIAANLALGKSSRGGGLSSSATSVVIENSTFTGNIAWYGGAIDSSGYVGIRNSTVAFNSAATSGGGLNRFLGTNLILDSVIVAKNTAPLGPDIYGTATANRCLFSSTTGSSITGTGNITSPDPLLLPLANNGGPTLTHSPASGSPALDAGSNPAGLTSDQRGPGFARVVGTAPDIGAVEGTVNHPIALPALTDVSGFGGTSYTFTVTFRDEFRMNVSSLGTGDVVVAGPGGFQTVPTFMGVDVNTNGTPRTATYRFTPPGGSWDYLENGTYTVGVAANEVFDTDDPTPHAALPGPLATFSVNVPVLFTVDITADESDGNTSAGDLSLREAIGLANAYDGADRLITFNPVVFATPTTITLTLGEIDIARSMTIMGPTAKLTIDANKASRILDLDVPNKSRQPITISDLSLINGNAVGGYGGAILNRNQALTLANATLTGNVAGDGGGAVASYTGAVAISDSILTGNSATSEQSEGGAIALFGAASIQITRCTISGNSASLAGGGLSFTASSSIGTSLMLTDCTVSGNQVTQQSSFFGGGGLSLRGANPTIRNCTISGNTAPQGGAIWYLRPSSVPMSSKLRIENTTIAFNTATNRGGGVYAYYITDLKSSAVAKNMAPVDPDFAGNASAQFSLIGDTGGLPFVGVSSLFNVDAKLGPLANNGGPTLTHKPLPGSPLINAGSNPANLLYDQRGPGFARVLGTAPEIGSVEAIYPPAVRSVVVNGGAAQRSMVTKVTVTFNSIVGLPANAATAFSLVRQGDNVPVGLTAVVDQSGTGTAVTLTFSGPATEFGSLADGRYTLTVDASKVANSFGSLDGNFDGADGDNYVLVGDPATNRLFRLFADSDGDGDVDAGDFLAFRATAGLSAFDPGFNLAFDHDADGDIDALDFLQFRARFGTSI